MLGDEEEVVSSGESEEFTEIDKMTKFYKDLNAIKERNKELKKELLKDGGKETKLTKHEEKEVKKLLKEQDKLERQALVARMQQRDKAQTEDKRIGQIVEN
jgi:cell shape-determining protein MreC